MRNAKTYEEILEILESFEKSGNINRTEFFKKSQINQNRPTNTNRQNTNGTLSSDNNDKRPIQSNHSLSKEPQFKTENKQTNNPIQKFSTPNKQTNYGQNKIFSNRQIQTIEREIEENNDSDNDHELQSEN